MNTSIQIDLNNENYENMFFVDLVAIANQRGVKVSANDTSPIIIGKLRLYDLEVISSIESDIPFLPDMD
jgi:hypothetical protein